MSRSPASSRLWLRIEHGACWRDGNDRFTGKTAIGALSNYIADGGGDALQTMNVNFRIMEGLTGQIKKEAGNGTRPFRRLLAYLDTELKKWSQETGGTL